MKYAHASSSSGGNWAIYCGIPIKIHKSSLFTAQNWLNMQTLRLHSLITYESNDCGCLHRRWLWTGRTVHHYEHGMAVSHMQCGIGLPVEKTTLLWLWRENLVDLTNPIDKSPWAPRTKPPTLLVLSTLGFHSSLTTGLHTLSVKFLPVADSKM